MSNYVMVMVNGLPGSMATKVYEHLLDADPVHYPFDTLTSSLTGSEIQEKQVVIGGRYPVSLVRPEDRFKLRGTMARIQERSTFIAVDYSHPSAVVSNAEFYCACGIPFVMGTTGGDRKRLAEVVEQSGNCAVIAPNMAKQIVAFQAMMEFAAKNFPDVFRGYTLEICESHQKGKADTSGTAKAMAEYFNAMGVPFTTKQIVMVREPQEQLAMGVPEDALRGHGWHTYTLRSPDGNILFQFTHNVNGRDIYAQGTLDAIKFLSRNIQPGRVYSMMDVLRGV